MDKNVRTGLVVLCVAIPLGLVALLTESTAGTVCGVLGFWLAVIGFASIAWGLIRGSREHAAD